MLLLFSYSIITIFLYAIMSKKLLSLIVFTLILIFFTILYSYFIDDFKFIKTFIKIILKSYKIGFLSL